MPYIGVCILVYVNIFKIKMCKNIFLSDQKFGQKEIGKLIVNMVSSTLIAYSRLHKRKLV